MPYKMQIAHDRRTDEYTLAMVMYRDADCTEWFAIQNGESIDKEVIDAMSEPILEYTSSEVEDE